MKKEPYKEHPNLEKLDWRLKGATTIAKDGKGIKKGDAIVVYIEVNYMKSALGFGLPNPTSLFLNSSYKLFKQAEALLESQHIKPVRGRRQTIENYEPIFDFYESLFASTVLAYTSIEAFTNEYIPDDYVYERISKGEKVLFDKINIEKWASLDEKLLEILPVVTGVKFSKQSKRWPDYKKLKNHRDRIIHMKSKDVSPNFLEKKLQNVPMHKADSIWNSLISPVLFNGHQVAFDVISHFINGLSDKKQPRWFKKYPNC